MSHIVFIVLIALASLIRLGLMFYWARSATREAGGRYSFQDVLQAFLPVEGRTEFDPQTARRIAVLKRYDDRANVAFILIAAALMLGAVWVA